jgi:hypothetical protein
VNGVIEHVKLNKPGQQVLIGHWPPYITLHYRKPLMSHARVCERGFANAKAFRLDEVNRERGYKSGSDGKAGSTPSGFRRVIVNSPFPPATKGA